MPKSKHRKGRKPMRDYGPLRVIWTNDDLTHAPAMDTPHVQADELAGIKMLTIWDYDRPSYITIGLYAAALRELDVYADPGDTLDELRAKLTRVAANQAIQAVKTDHP